MFPPGIYYAFWCQPFWQNFYMLTGTRTLYIALTTHPIPSTVAGFIATGLIFRNIFNKEEYFFVRYTIGIFMHLH